MFILYSSSSSTDLYLYHINVFYKLFPYYYYLFEEDGKPSFTLICPFSLTLGLREDLLSKAKEQSRVQRYGTLEIHLDATWSSNINHQ